MTAKISNHARDVKSLEEKIIFPLRWSLALQTNNNNDMEEAESFVLGLSLVHLVVHN